MKKILKNVDTDKQQQHSKLMDEFKKAHKKMFKATDDTASAQNTSDGNNNAVSTAYFFSQLTEAKSSYKTMCPTSKEKFEHLLHIKVVLL